MQIVVTHLTHMSPGFVCVAGVNLVTGQHVRPLMNRPLSLRHTAAGGGPFDLGATVDLGYARYQGEPPEIEDHSFMEHNLRALGRVDPLTFWAIVEGGAEVRLQHIFGSTLNQVGTTCAVERRRGSASLGCLIPNRVHELLIE